MSLSRESGARRGPCIVQSSHFINHQTTLYRQAIPPLQTLRVVHVVEKAAGEDTSLHIKVYVVLAGINIGGSGPKWLNVMGR